MRCAYCNKRIWRLLNRKYIVCQTFQNTAEGWEVSFKSFCSNDCIKLYEINNDGMRVLRHDNDGLPDATTYLRGDTAQDHMPLTKEEEVKCIRAVLERLLRVMDEGLYCDYQLEKWGRIVKEKKDGT